MPVWLIAVFVAIFGAIIKECSPLVRKKVEDFLIGLEKSAKETPNVFDDMLVDFLKRVMKVDSDA